MRLTSLDLVCPKCDGEVEPHQLSVGVEHLHIEGHCLNPDCAMTTQHITEYQELSILAFCRLENRNLVCYRSDTVH